MKNLLIFWIIMTIAGVISGLSYEVTRLHTFLVLALVCAAIAGMVMFFAIPIKFFSDEDKNDSK